MNIVFLNQVMLNGAELNRAELNTGGGVPMTETTWGDFYDSDDLMFMTADDMMFQVKV